MSKIKNLRDWHNAICEQANYICTICEQDFSDAYYFVEDRNVYVCGHHLKTQGAHPELKFDPNNGICVCQKCHLGIHNGKSSNFLE